MRLERADVERLRLSALLYGFGCLPHAIRPTILGRLRVEARRRSISVTEQTEGVAYRARIGTLGARARQFLRGGQLASLLLAVFGQRYVLSEQRSCVTQYIEGDCLGPHLDEPRFQCAVTVIVYLAAKRRRRQGRTGLQLKIYGRTLPRNRKPRLILPTRTGALVVGRGSKFWHERPTLSEGERVLALTACYRPS